MARLGWHAVPFMTAEVYGAADDSNTMVSELLHTLSCPIMQLHHLLWRATAVDHAINAVSMRRPHALTYRRTSLLVVVVRVLPHGEPVPGTQCTLPLPPPRARTTAVAASWWSPSPQTTRVYCVVQCSGASRPHG